MNLFHKDIFWEFHENDLRFKLKFRRYVALQKTVKKVYFKYFLMQDMKENGNLYLVVRA